MVAQAFDVINGLLPDITTGAIKTTPLWLND